MTKAEREVIDAARETVASFARDLDHARNPLTIRAYVKACDRLRHAVAALPNEKGTDHADHDERE